jgi:FG-GAP-like repeat/PASTA domain
MALERPIRKEPAMRPPHAELRRRGRERRTGRAIVLLACIGAALGGAARSADHAGLALAATTSKASFPAVSLSGPHNYRAGRHPTSVAVADLNGDHKLDLAVANESGTVSVLLNPGSGRFKTRHVYGAGSSPASVAVADLNGDHKPDLVVANAGANTVSVLLNTGAGHFAPKHDYGTGSGTVDVAIGDLNGDGRPDLVTANSGDDYDSSTISVLSNEGGGSFGPKIDYQLPQDSYVSSVAISDINGDGTVDLVAADSPSVSVFLNSGQGSFGARRDYKSFGDSLAIADLNGDHRPDLVTATSLTVSVLLSRADGTFAPARNYSTGIYSQSISIGDLNHDGKPDVVTTDSISPNQEDCDTGDGFEVSVLPNKGHGKLGRYLSFSTYYDGCDPVSSAIADVTGDRRPDVVTANNFSGTVSVLVNAVGRCAVPDLTLDGYYTLGGTKRVLTRAGCRPGRIGYVYSKVTRGYVISQRPGWGTVLRKGGKVNLVVSRGPKH